MTSRHRKWTEQNSPSRKWSINIIIIIHTRLWLRVWMLQSIFTSMMWAEPKARPRSLSCVLMAFSLQYIFACRYMCTWIFISLKHCFLRQQKYRKIKCFVKMGSAFLICYFIFFLLSFFFLYSFPPICFSVILVISSCCVSIILLSPSAAQDCTPSFSHSLSLSVCNFTAK